MSSDCDCVQRSFKSNTRHLKDTDKIVTVNLPYVGSSSFKGPVDSKYFPFAIPGNAGLRAVLL